jgi:hypothetical protein
MMVQLPLIIFAMAIGFVVIIVPLALRGLFRYYRPYIEWKMGEPRKGRSLLYDLLFGVLLPCGCLVVDPFFFRPFLPGRGVDVQMLSPWVFGSFALAMVCLVIQLAVGQRLKRFSPVLGGALFAAAGAATLVGLALLPVSIICVPIYGLGLLGLAPFVAAWVYMSSGYRAMLTLNAPPGSRVIMLGALLGAAMFIAAPVALQVKIGSDATIAVEDVLDEDGNLDDAIRVLKRPLSYPWRDEIVWAYHHADNEEKKQHLRLVYKRITGGDIAKRMWILLD